MINTINDAENFLNKFNELRIKDFRFLNETGFTTKYYTRSDKPGVFRKKFTGAEGDCTITKNVKPEMILEDSKFINEVLGEKNLEVSKKELVAAIQELTINNSLFPEDNEIEETTKKHTLEGITNELEDITDEQVADIKQSLLKGIPAGKDVSEDDINLDSRSIYLNWTTLDRTLEMYKGWW